MKEIPVFYHIPKCAGSYIKGKVFPTHLSPGFNQQGQKYRRVHLSINGKQPWTIQAWVELRGEASDLPRRYAGRPGKNVEDTLANFTKYLKQGLIELGAISLTGRISAKYEMVDEWMKISSREPFYFTIMREPFSWHQSMFYYLRDMGTWERAYGKFEGMSFSDYINSNQLADSWIIRNLTGLDDSLPITDKEYNQTIEMLSSKFTIGFIDNVDELVQNLIKKFGWPYGKLNLKDEDTFVNVNKKSHKKPISEISKHDLEVFTTRTKYDAMLYEHFKGKQS